MSDDQRDHLRALRAQRSRRPVRRVAQLLGGPADGLALASDAAAPFSTRETAGETPAPRDVRSATIPPWVCKRPYRSCSPAGEEQRGMTKVLLTMDAADCRARRVLGVRARLRPRASSRAARDVGGDLTAWDSTSAGTTPTPSSTRRRRPFIFIQKVAEPKTAKNRSHRRACRRRPSRRTGGHARQADQLWPRGRPSSAFDEEFTGHWIVMLTPKATSSASSSGGAPPRRCRRDAGGGRRSRASATRAARPAGCRAPTAISPRAMRARTPERSAASGGGVMPQLSVSRAFVTATAWSGGPLSTSCREEGAATRRPAR